MIIKNAQENQDHGFFYEVDSTNGAGLNGTLEKIQRSFPLFKSENRK